MTSVFINYRIADNEGFGRSIKDRLQLRLGEAVRLDLDVDGAIRPGEPFPAELRARVSEAGLILAVIGPRWVEILQERAKQPQDDWVRFELVLAKSLGKTIIPVLIGGAEMPRVDQLPEELAFLPPLQGVTIPPGMFDAGVSKLEVEVRGRLAARRAPAPQWLWWSTRDSFTADIPSVTAIIETLLAVLAYWWVAIYYETYWPLIAGATVAPMMLLRSDKSVAISQQFTKLIDKWTTSRSKDKSWGIADWACFSLGVAISATVNVFLSGLLASKYLSDLTDWPALVGGIAVGYGASVIGLIVTQLALVIFMILITCSISVVTSSAFFGSIAGAIAIAFAEPVPGLVVGNVGVLMLVFAMIGRQSLVFKNVGLIILGPAFVISAIVPGVFFSFVVFLIRSCAAWWYLYDGLCSVPRNFRRILFCASPLHEPELIPGTPDDHSLATKRMLREFKEAWVFGETNAIGIFTIIVLLFFPLWFYRISFKSTAWLWWPIAFIGAPPIATERLTLFRRLEIDSLWGRTTRVLALVVLIVFGGLAAAPEALQALPHVPRLLISALFTVDPALPLYLQWQWLGPLLGVLSVAMVLWVDAAHIRFEEARKSFDIPAQAAARFEFYVIEIVGRFRALMTLTFICLVGGYMVLMLNSRAAPACWFAPPRPVQIWGEWVYGQRMPSVPVCSTIAIDRGR